MRGVTVISTQTGVHGFYELEVAGVLHTVAGTTNGYDTVFERLAKYLKRVF